MNRPRPERSSDSTVVFLETVAAELGENIGEDGRGCAGRGKVKPKESRGRVEGGGGGGGGGVIIPKKTDSDLQGDCVKAE